MPACLTHILIATGAFKQVEEQELSHLISRNFHAFLWGAQGPDVLMHGGYWPWRKPGDTFLIGGRMHKQYVNEVFQRFYSYIQSKKQEKEWETLVSYYLGFLSHHATDSIFHPYVYQTIDFIKKERGRGLKQSTHYNIEENIDVALLEWLYHVTPYQFTAYHTLDRAKEICLPICTMYEQGLGTLFGRVLKEKELYHCFLDMHFLQKFIYNPHGMKCGTINFIEKHFGKRTGFNYMTHRKVLDSSYDYCNEGRKLWNCPRGGNHQSGETIFELYQVAVEESLVKIETIWKWMEEGKKDLENLFGNISYESGVSLEKGEKDYGKNC